MNDLNFRINFTTSEVFHCRWQTIVNFNNMISENTNINVKTLTSVDPLFFTAAFSAILLFCPSVSVIVICLF